MFHPIKSITNIENAPASQIASAWSGCVGDFENALACRGKGRTNPRKHRRYELTFATKIDTTSDADSIETETIELPVKSATAADIENKIAQTAKNMNRYREKLGNKPIIITSWYRSSQVNSSVGGFKWSRHQYGDGVDWVCSHLTPAQIASKLKANHNDGGYKCYHSKNFTHTDWRGYKARW